MDLEGSLRGLLNQIREAQWYIYAKPLFYAPLFYAFLR
jgi:hypothetical protein